jgi:hypothetical protein
MEEGKEEDGDIVTIPGWEPMWEVAAESMT